MDIETDPRLIGDPFWSAIAKVINNIRKKPRLFRETIPEAEFGLNYLAINKLASEHQLSEHPIIEAREKPGEWDKPDRWIDIYHPKLPEPIEILVWRDHGIGEVPNGFELERILAYLQAWQYERKGQIAGDSAESVVVDSQENAANRHDKRKSRRISEADKKALISFLWVQQSHPELVPDANSRNKYTPEMHAAAKECDVYQEDDRGRLSLSPAFPHKFGTWTRQIRNGLKKFDPEPQASPRGGRQHGTSIVDADKV